MFDVIVIGAGPSGMTAALNILRAGKTCLVLEKETIGGQIAVSPRVENLPSIKEISGIDFSNNLFDQICDLGASFELEEVLEIKPNGKNFIVKTNYNSYDTKAVIIATGVSHRPIGIEREEELVGKGVSYCAVCDGAFYKGDDVVLIGDANTALQYALLLSSYCPKVYLNTLFNKFFADKILVDRILSKENIIVKHNLSLKKLLGEEQIEGADFVDTKTNELVHFTAKAVFICVGQMPHNEAFRNIVKLDDHGYIIVNENMETNVEGIYAVGDARVKKMRQVVTAVSDGAIAAFNATNYIG